MIPLLAILYFGGYVLTAACFLIGIMGVREFYNGFHAMGVKPNYGIAVAAAAALYIINIFGEKSEWYMLWFFGVVLVSMLYLFNIEHRKLEDAMATITGIFYVVFFSFHVTLVDQAGPYGLMLWLIVITAFGTDIMAYFSGYLLGKHKLCPHISPKKTIEGFLGGIASTIVVFFVFSLIYGSVAEVKVRYVWVIVIAAACAVISVLGDLTASILKRQCSMKDFGNIMPGHGGVMDRFDSALFTVPVFYVLNTLLSIYHK